MPLVSFFLLPMPSNPMHGSSDQHFLTKRYRDVKIVLLVFATLALAILLLRDWVPLLINQALLTHDAQGLVQRVKLGLGRAVGLEVTVGPGEVLAVVDSEVDVVEGVMGGAVDVLFEPVASDHVGVVDENGPDLHQEEKNHVQIFLSGANEDENARCMSATQPPVMPTFKGAG
jgi:hypothetical protein